MPGVGLLPASLIEIWRDESLPDWVAQELNIPVGSGFEALGPDWSEHADTLTRRVERFLTTRLQLRRSHIKDVPVFNRPWPSELTLDLLVFSTRTENCLQDSGMGDAREKFSRITFGDLVRIPRMGARSALEFAAAADALLARHQSPPTPESEASAERLFEVLDSDWIEFVSASDPRFSDVLPPIDGTLLEWVDAVTDRGHESTIEIESVAQQLPALERRVDRIRKLPLDQGIEDYVRALTGFSGDRLDALLARLGCGAEPPITLSEAGKLLGVSRERIRQLQEKMRLRRPEHPVFLPSLDRALELLVRAAPIEVRAGAALLQSEGISRVPYHPKSVLAAAELCGRPQPFTLERTNAGTRVVTQSTSAIGAEVTRLARKRSGSSGVSNSSEILRALEDRNPDLTNREVRDALIQYAQVEFLVDDWFWVPAIPTGRNRLVNLGKKMLAVTTPLDISTIREGIRRRMRFLNASRHRTNEPSPYITPPRAVLAAFFRAHSDFICDETGLVRSRVPLDYRQVLGAAEAALVEIFRASPAGALDRESVWRAVAERGINQNTITIHMTYSSIIEHIDTDIWSLRGSQIDPAAIEAIRRANQQQPRARRVVNHGWTEDGKLWMAVRLPYSGAWGSFGIPAGISQYLAGSKFDATSSEGASEGSIVVDERGQSWGYGAFLRRSGADEDDILRVEFDLQDRSATLLVGGSELVEED